MSTNDKWAFVGAFCTLAGLALMIACGYIWFGPTAAMFSLALCLTVIGYDTLKVAVDDDDEENKK